VATGLENLFFDIKMTEVKFIIVGSKKVGILGLEEVFSEVKSLNLSEEETKEKILKRISEKNYIPVGARDLFKDALFREYKKFLGEEVREEVTENFLDIKVLGVKCAKCDSLEKDVREVLAELDLPAEIEHISDPREIARYGIVSTPSLVINGKIVSKGKSLKKSQIVELILRTWENLKK